MPDPLQAVDWWLVDSLVVPASLHDVHGRFVHMNSAAERASGKSNTEMLGGDITTLLPREVHENVVAQFRRAVEGGEPTDFETAFVDASGETAAPSWGFSSSRSMCAGSHPSSSA
jgi:PAS domain S-box-containing protein